MKKYTQHDVARVAGVSRATVSYVINGVDNGSVSDETRERVLAAIKELGYVPNATAQSLRSGQTHMIGVLLPDMRNPHFWHVLEGIETAANQANYHLLVKHTEPHHETSDLYELFQRRVDGFILMLSTASHSRRILRPLQKANRPIVELPNTETDNDCVFSDFGEGAWALLNLLLELNHRRIGFIFGIPEGQEAGMDRWNAFHGFHAENHLPLDEHLVVRCGGTMEDGYTAAHQLLGMTNRPTAIVVINDLLAIGAIRAAHDLGLQVPQDVSIAGFDNIPISSFITPRLTTVHQDTEAVGQEAVRLLLQRLENPEMPKQMVRLTARLLVRESTGPAPA